MFIVRGRPQADEQQQTERDKKGNNPERSNHGAFAEGDWLDRYSIPLFVTVMRMKHEGEANMDVSNNCLRLWQVVLTAVGGD